VIADRKRALITSANFTEAAWLRNIELGALLNYEPLVSRLVEYFDGLIANQFLRLEIISTMYKCIVVSLVQAFAASPRQGLFLLTEFDRTRGASGI
jgi:phosphatidylserine/phosphatidylglycerophosphate/cardiolipin synthase-like enzyme